ncbi:hypothetical protein PRLR6025_12860 [Prevotella lacticifex]|nr:hypothetical protein PRLR6025_12860 [Prevotella lacticifex]
MKNMKKKYIKPVSEVITVEPGLILRNTSDSRYQLVNKNNGLFDMYKGREQKAPGTIDDTEYNGGIIESKYNPWSSWDEE